jgi:hypothetical protein
MARKAGRKFGTLTPGDNALDLTRVFAQQAQQQAVAAARAEESSASGYALNGDWTLDDAYLLECYLNELNARNGESLAVYQPVPGAGEFHQCLAGEIGLVGSNRAGKSVAAGVEVALAATGRHPVADKYPDGGLEIALVGPGEKHLRLLYKILFKPGQFKLIQDADGSWRVPSYDSPGDVARMKEWVDAPPLIPPRMVESESWIDKKAEEPAAIRLVNGTILYFYSFESNPPQGVVYHLVWMDEEHPRASKWLSEMRMRVMSVSGRTLWSATPENATPTFYNLKSRADRPDMATKKPIAQTRFFELYSKDNPYIPPDAREAAYDRLREDDPDAAVAKIEGEWAFRKYLVYPEFDENRHLIEPFDLDHKDSWYVVIDPSITRCAILFAAVVSPESQHYLPAWPDRLVVTDEVVIENCTAAKAARAVRRVMDQRRHWIEKVVFDFRHGRKREDDGGMIAEKYWAALKAESVQPRIDKIVWGSDNFADGIDAVKEFLAPKGDLPPRLVGMRGRVRWWTWEFHRYHRRKNPDGTPGKIHRKKDDLMDCTRYLVANNPQWVTPPGLDHRTEKAYTADELRQFERNPVEHLYGHLYRRKPA